MALILIVDDEETIRLLIRMMLESVGHSVFEAQDGGVALDILETYPDPFDVIVLDLLMPRMDGVEFLSAMHNRVFYPHIIVLTTHEAQIPKALAHRVSGRLVKPFSKQALIDLVNSVPTVLINL